MKVGFGAVDTKDAQYFLSYNIVLFALNLMNVPLGYIYETGIRLLRQHVSNNLSDQ